MSGRLDGKVAVITGAAGGIGREAALLFSTEGACVCVADVAREQGEATAAECRDAFFHEVDVAGPASVERLYRAVADRYGGVDVLYNNAGIMPPDDGMLLETGVLSVNANTSVRVQTPFGGFKQSGFGRELGMHALEGYSEIKNVFFAT